MKKLYILFSAIAFSFLSFQSYAQCNITVGMDSTNVTCFNGDDGTVTGLASGGTTPYSYFLGSASSFYCSAPTSCGTDYITGVTLDTIQNLNTFCNGYTFYNSQLAVLASGQSETLSVSVNNNSNNLYLTAWIDWDNDGSFAGVGEKIVLALGDSATNQYSTILNVPQNLPGGVIRMRIQVSSGSQAHPCSSNFTGETEDYQLAITASNNVFTGLTAGNYTLFVIDGAGCQANRTFQITQPAQLNTSVMAIQVPNCNQNNGALMATTSGGTPFSNNTPYNLNWSNGSSTDTISNIGKGVYTVTITDSLGCTVSRSFNLIDNSGLDVETSLVNDVSCNGLADGDATAFLGGFNSIILPYTFQWSNGQTGTDLVDVTAGLYTVTVTDTLGCTDSDTIRISEPPVLQNTVLSTVDLRCFEANDGAVDVDPDGGDSTSYTLIYSNRNHCTITGPSCQYERIETVTFAGLSHTTDTCTGGYGDFSETVAPFQVFPGSSYNLQINIDALVNEYLTVWIDWNNNGDFDDAGEEYIIASGSSSTFYSQSILVPFISQNTTIKMRVALRFGTAPLNCGTWAFGDVKDYSINIGNPSTVYGNLPAGNYGAVVMDGNGCFASDNFTIAQPNEIEPTVTALNEVSCNGGEDGSIQLAVAGGTTPYVLEWSDGTIGNSVSGLASGFYDVTITDNNGCAEVFDTLVTEPTLLQTSSFEEDLLCAGAGSGNIEVFAFGGTEPYSYNWSNGYADSVANDLAAGNYIVTVSDNNGCADTLSFDIVEPDSIEVEFEIINESRCGEFDGVAKANVTGGVGNYTYIWGKGDSTQNTSQLFTAVYNGLGAGKYNLMVIDGNECSSLNTFHVSCPVGLAELSDNEAISVYPNPNNGKFNLHSSHSLLGSKIQIFSMDGKMVYDLVVTSQSQLNEISIEDFAKGIYVLKVVGDINTVKQFSVQ